MIGAPPLRDVALGEAGLWAVEAQGFSQDSTLLVVKAVYTDPALASVSSRTAFWLYDLTHSQYSLCVNDVIASERAIEVTDVAIGRFGAQVQLIANYHDTLPGSGPATDRLALIRDGVLIQGDLIQQVTGQTPNAAISAVKASANGRFVAIETTASNLAAGVDTNGCKDIYVLDLLLNTSRLITTVNGAESGSDSLLGDIVVGTDGGLSVSFQSAQAFSVQDSNAADDVYVWHLAQASFGTGSSGTVELVSRAVAGAVGGTTSLLNLAGTLFESDSGGFLPADHNSAVDVWLVASGTVSAVSASGSGVLTSQTTLGSSSDGGRYVALMTASPEVAGATGVDQLVIVDTVGHSSTVVSHSAGGALADDAVFSPVLSPNGSLVVFSSQASNLGTGAADGQMHLYLLGLDGTRDSVEVVNSAPTGSVAITGTPTQGQSLSVDTSLLADGDGLGTFTWQWLRAGLAISGANAATYTLTQADVSSAISVRVSYTDGGGNAEHLDSAATALVANVNDLPTGTVTITGDPSVGKLLVATNSLTDIDGLGVIGYQWQAGGIPVSGATGSEFTLTADQVGTTVTVVASYVDGFGVTESKASSPTAIIASVDTNPPTVVFADNVPGTVNRSTPSVVYSLVFNEPVTGLDTSDFTVSNGIVNSVAGYGTSWSVNVTPALGVASGAMALTLKAGAVSDAAGNFNVAITNSSQALDTVAPVAPKLVTTGAFDFLINPQITLQTSLGTVVFELNPEAAPITVANMLAYVNAGFYDGTEFHRVMPGFMVQGGGFNTGLVYKTPTYSAIALESTNGLSNLRGTLAMARNAAPDSATTQFFINQVDNLVLNYSSPANAGYAVFGRVLSGLSVIDSIASVPTVAVGTYTNVPVTEVVITSMQQTVAGSSISNAATLTLSGLEAGSQWSYSLDGGTTWATGTGATLSLPEGTYAASAIQVRQTDAAGNVSASAGQLTSALKVDMTSPTISSFTPSNEAHGVSVNSNIVVNFNEAISAGAGTVSLKTSAGVTVARYDINSSNLHIAGNTLTVNPSEDLDIFTSYTLEVGTGAIRDLAGNSYGGANQYNFTTETVDSLYHFFVVAFAAAPGVEYMNQLAEAYNWGLNLKEIVNIFTTKHQFTDVYSEALTSSQLATQLVANVVKDSASAQARAQAEADISWCLDHGWTRGDVIYQVFGNLATKSLLDPDWGQTAQQFLNQTAVARYFTEVMNQNTTDLPTLRAVVGDVTPATDVSTPELIATLIGIELGHLN